MIEEKISIFWFRRDLRLDDNRGLNEALNGRFPVLPIFIFDENITGELEDNDPRITFIFEQLQIISHNLDKYSCSLYCKKGDPLQVWETLIDEFDVQEVYTNEDYEPYAIQRDKLISKLFDSKNINFRKYKDQVIFAGNDILKNDNSPYTVFTPYKNKWLSTLENDKSVLNSYIPKKSGFAKFTLNLPSLEKLGFRKSSVKVRNYRLDILDNYEAARNFPGLDQTSYLSPHLRFGAVSIRRMVSQSLK